MKSIHKCLAIAGLAILASCSAPKDVAYFQDTESKELISIAKQADIRLRPGDKVMIMVTSKDKELVDLFNLPYITRQLGTDYSNNSGLAGYSINKDGYINYPVLGMVKIAGLTRAEVAEKIEYELKSRELVKDAIVTVEFQNLSVSVLGEVNRPGRFTIDRDNVTILDALSMAGDLNINGRRDHIKVTRNEDGQQHTYVIDLTSAESTFGSPVYYLQQNDVVYVEPNNNRKRQSTTNANTFLSASFWISLASVLTSMAVLIFK